MADGSSALDEWFTHGDSISASDCRPSRGFHSWSQSLNTVQQNPCPGCSRGYCTCVGQRHPANRHRERTSVVSGAAMEAQLEKNNVGGLWLEVSSYLT